MTPKIPIQPLDKIALSCSGGGYRAASFHLGAMAYLNRIRYKGKPLLENVKLISTVSGGTITGAVYALKKQEGKSFEEIYDFLLEKLHTLDLIKLSLQKLNPGISLNNPCKRKNLINAFAELYDQHFTLGATFEVFNTMHSHLDAVIFNSTEFNNGINFRFRNTGSGYFGNNYLRINSSVAQEVKIADAIASSSCFPGGFEPMVWPHDFIHDKSPNLEELQKQSPNGVGIMDGGIYDNQGIQSILLYKKNDETPYFDLVIISDVASPQIKPFKPSEENPKEGLRTLSLNSLSEKINTTNTAINISLVATATLLLVIPFFWKYRLSFYTGISIGLAVAPLSVLLFKWVLKLKVNSVIQYFKKVLEGIVPVFFRRKLAELKIGDISIHRAEPLLLDRLNSLITLLMNVFLKVVRRLNYNDLYEDQNYTYRRMSNLIKELAETNFVGKSKSNHQGDTPINQKNNSILAHDYDALVGSKIKAIAEEASCFGTTLWFTDDDQLHDMLNKLVATGQFTMCYNMIDYLEQILFITDNGFEKLDSETQRELRELYTACQKDWDLFKSNPMFMLKVG